ncbi:reverse transcriptase/maturase family protein [Erythrobacter sp. SDW2]|uniref:reverse transcriptase domain-containing protein n=1 Tax=Erythrobacter sp. SDW2 TaxID=2907154 RepID=UPI001F3CA371|nr:reverse transcriptase domain-containing protein [Erythrobacter sp. SDW2]UIP06336.1 reverse transcriptase/maturase family protein [Erythrobacter sp. SDW2]
MFSKLRKAVHKSSNLEDAWRVIYRNGKSSNSEDVRQAIERFSEDPAGNLRSIQSRLSRGTFDFGKARGAPILKRDGKGKPTGKIRPIVIASLEARIVQRAILNVLVEIPALKPFANTPFSFGGLRRVRNRDETTGDDLSAVPAAIKAVLDEIGRGARWIAAADITGFFTKIPKSTVAGIIRDAIKDDDLMALLEDAISVELANLSELQKFRDQFPIEDIGVAQGNSLSPLLGNILLAAFDKAMNEGDCRCIRYIDDFIILAPTKKAANARLKKAKGLLEEFDMELAPEKSSREAHEVSKSFEFLGIEISPGFVRPAKRARIKFLASIDTQLNASKTAITGLRHGHKLDPKLALIATLKRIDGMIDGWGKHYWFCNDRQLFRAVDEKVRSAIGAYLGAYSDTRNRLPEGNEHLPLGLTALGEMERSPFAYPKLSSSVST